MASGRDLALPLRAHAAPPLGSREWRHALHQQLPPTPHTGKRVQEEAV